MCDVQAKLIAWLDRELPKDEASAVERHIEGCGECRQCLSAFRQVSETFDAYCDAVMTRKAPRQVASWVPVLAGVIVATAVIFLALPQTRVAPPTVVEPTVAAVSERARGPVVAEPAPRKIMVQKRHSGPGAPRVPQYATLGQPMDIAIQIAIPAEAMFPPGAMPNGVNFIADLRIGPDGSVEQVRLRQ